MNSQARLVVDSYCEWTCSLIERGFKPYLISFMFYPVSGSMRVKMQTMMAEIERVYALFLTRVVRRPHSRSAQGGLPVWIVCPDFPVAKHSKFTLREVTINDGLHIHAIALIPPSNRLKGGFAKAFRSNRQLYHRYPIMDTDIRPIKERPEYVTGYALKAIARHRADLDDILILPRTSSEVSRR